MGKTLGDIARETGISYHRLAYFVKAHGIEPIARHGGSYRIYGPAEETQILAAVQKGDKYRKGAR
jgi:DNA-binding transcriptional MerR regulator